MIVITLSKVPASLRGDLTKWYQEVQTGVYVGNVSARIRDNLWERILRDIGSGQATMVYNAQNEFGYQFRTTRHDHQVIDYDGIPLLMHLNNVSNSRKSGFSDAAKFHQAHVHARHRPAAESNVELPNFIVLDIETTGLNATQDQIIAIGAVKHDNNQDTAFDRLIAIDADVPPMIAKLTGITTADLLVSGVSLRDALNQLLEFIGNLPLIGFNARFDEEFISNALSKQSLPGLSNELTDLLPVVKRASPFIENYKLTTVLHRYEIDNPHPHQALSDAKATFLLAKKLIESGNFHIG